MCGICGFITDKSMTINQLDYMNNLMSYRGPNDSGSLIFKTKDRMIGLAHRRLSIMDLSDLGHQPMLSNDGNVVVVFNGEIYNFKEIKKELNSYHFISNCDTEVIIASYLKWGIKCFEKFNGMFAIAIFDRKQEALYLARDRFGKKPLYFWFNNKDFVFSSECKPIMAYPWFRKEVNTETLNYYFSNEYIQAPETIFKNMYKLESGCVLSYKNNHYTISKYWDSLERYKEFGRSRINNYEEAIVLLDDILNDAVSKRMVADVPIGILLSGGIDSSLVAAMATSQASAKIKTFSIGFENPQYNEAQYAQEISSYLKTDHTSMIMSDVEAVSLIDDLPFYFDEPFADASLVPTMLVSMLAKKSVSVVLTGDGADEFFCGYSGRYANVSKAQKYDFVGNALYQLLKSSTILNDYLTQYLPRRVKSLVNNRDNAYRTQFHVDAFRKYIDLILPNHQGSYKYNATRFLQNNWQEEAMLVDQATYLQSVLCKVDRASMKYALECRSPFLDYRVVELSYRLPQSFKFDNHSKGKRIVKDLLYRYIPRKLLDRPKHGFGAPVGQWLKKSLKNELLDYANEALINEQGIFDSQGVQHLLKLFLNDSNLSSTVTPVVWRYFVFQKWYNYYFFNNRYQDNIKN